MYVWVVLATFLAVLASFALSPREDIRAVTVEPLAEAQVAKIVTRQKAALEYVKYRKKPYTVNPEAVEYAPMVLSAGELEAYMPHGHIASPNYVTKIFCMNEMMTIAYGDQANCSNKHNSKMVVTFGQVPLRWINLNSERGIPTADFMNAVRNMVDSGTSFGYTAPVESGASTDRNISGSPMRLVDRDNSDLYVPLAVVSDGDFNEICGLDQDKACLVYQSSI